MRAFAIIKIEIFGKCCARRTDAIVGMQIGEWREALQPRALPEPDVNLAIHPAPIIQPQASKPNGQIGQVYGASAIATIPIASLYDL